MTSTTDFTSVYLCGSRCCSVTPLLSCRYSNIVARFRPRRPCLIEERARAFTLVELMVVVGLITILAAFLGLALSPGSAGSRLSSGETIATGMVQAARAQAMLKSTKARCIVNFDPDDRERYLRYLGVVFLNQKDNLWYAANAGSYLPKGIYYSRESLTETTGPSTKPGLMRIDFPRSEGRSEGDGGPEWIFYEFNGRGISRNPGAPFLIGVGSVVDSEGTLDVEEEEIRSGFVIHRLGGISRISD